MPDSFKLSQEHTQKATLGCGTLILIALIVAIFSNHSSDDVERGLDSLRGDVSALKKSIDAQSQQIRELHDALQKGEPAKKTAEALPENSPEHAEPQKKSLP
jgi:septal ring factor EnvC (AmiA/AmiB activator)